MNALVCFMALMSPHRPGEAVGGIVARYDIYRTDKTEHCFEQVTKLGWTWVEDEILSLREVELRRCP